MPKVSELLDVSRPDVGTTSTVVSEERPKSRSSALPELEAILCVPPVIDTNGLVG